MKLLSVERVLRIHEYQIAQFGGVSGLRDGNGLKSAVGAASATLGGEFLNSTVEEMAAAYLIQLVNKDPFIDGSKRTGTAAAIAFMMMNGYRLTASNEKLTELVLNVAQSKAGRTDVTLFFREWARKAQA